MFFGAGDYTPSIGAFEWGEEALEALDGQGLVVDEVGAEWGGIH